MAVTVLIRQGGDALHGSTPSAGGQEPKASPPPAKELSITLDAPRIVIGRGKSCDIQLPDPSVSSRHASIRFEGGRNLVMDEGSVNGVLVLTKGERTTAAVRLPPQTPRALSDGDFIRIGRVWLEVSFSAAMPSSSADVKSVAFEVLRHALEEEGESTAARLTKDGTTALTLIDTSKEHVIGRAQDSALMLTDELVSRQHAVVARDGERWAVRDLGSKRGTTLGDAVVDRAGKTLSDGDELVVGATKLVFRDPLQNALAEMRAADDIKLPASALPAAPPGMEVSSIVEAPPEGLSVSDEEIVEDDEEGEDTGPSALDRLAEEPRSTGFAAVDAFLVLIALGVLGVSALGLAYVLG